MGIWIFRAFFVVVASAAAYAFGADMGNQHVWLAMGILLSCAVVLLEVFVTSRPIALISSVVFGSLVGLLLAVVTERVLALVMGDVYQDSVLQEQFRRNLTLMLIVIYVYLGISFLYQTRDKFRILIPYIEFRREEKGARPVVLDTSVIVDGRIAGVLGARVIDGPIIVPHVVLQELHRLADSEDKLRRERGRLGMKVLDEVRNNKNLDVRIERIDSDASQPVDEQLVQIAKKMNARIITNDYNLNRLATLEGVEIINLNELANALKPIALPDEQLTVKLLRRGEQPGQAVGFLEDGTMVVVEDALSMLGKEVAIVVTNTITRDTGRIIFGRLASPAAPSSHGGGMARRPPGRS
jgi:uncharacterized protein YacL